MTDQITEYQESKILIEWFEKNKRNLPWRNTKDPYFVWISEIILQQTRVNQGLAFYLRFIGRFPDIKSLAEADQAEVLKFWQGLGYYSRARNLHEAAKSIQANFQGVFPQRYEDVLTLKGIGSYTAAAIVSIVWNQPYPVLDGNVFRVLGRLFAMTVAYDTGEGRKQYEALARLLMNPLQAGLHNQAIMEFGALQCVPQKPDCSQCPLQNKCLGFASGDPLQFPVKQHIINVRARYFNYFFIVHKDLRCTCLSRRLKKDIWEGLFEFPLIETARSMDFEELQDTAPFKALFGDATCLTFTVVSGEVKHVLTHQILYVRFYRVEIQEANLQPRNNIALTDQPAEKIIQSALPGLNHFISVPLDHLDDYAFPRPIHRFLPILLQ